MLKYQVPSDKLSLESDLKEQQKEHKEPSNTKRGLMATKSQRDYFGASLVCVTSALTVISSSHEEHVQDLKELDEETLVTCSEKTISLWSRADGRCLRRLEHSHRVMSFTTNSSCSDNDMNDWIVFGDDLGGVHIWNPLSTTPSSVLGGVNKAITSFQGSHLVGDTVCYWIVRKDD